jgi:O-antigen/teichoic acid export membrane protein
LSKVRKSIFYLVAESYFSIVLQLIMAAIISRLLSPAEAGVFQVAAAFATMASTFRDFGVAEYLIQKTDLDERSLRRALGMNILLSWSIGLVLFFASGPISVFYNAPQIAKILPVLAVNFAIIPFGAVTMALFRRDMNFAPLFWSGILANIVTFSVSVSLAFLGFGAMCLAWASLAGVIVSVGVALWYRPANMPRWPLFTELGEIISFGKHATSVYLVGQVGKSAPELIIGKVLSMSSVAFFSRGSSLLELFHRSVLRSIIPLCLPYFSSEVRAGRGITNAYVRAVSYLTGVGWPFLIYVAVLAEHIVRVLYGDQWTPAVRVGQLICIAGMIELVHSLSKEALIAVGRVERSNLLQLITQASRIAAIAASAAFGLEAIGYGLILASAIGFVAAQRELSKYAQVSLVDTLDATDKSLWLSIAVFFVVWSIYRGIPGHFNAFLILASTGIAFTVVWFSGLKLTRHVIWPEVAASIIHVTQRLRSR